MEKAGKHQEIFDTLSDLECKLYYGMQSPGNLPFEDIAEIHKHIKSALVIWQKITGYTNQ
jgi:hypothetical protein